MNNEEKNIIPEAEGAVEGVEATVTEKSNGGKKLSGGVLAAIIGGVALIIVAVVLAIVLLGGDQGNQEPPALTYADYTVTVVDGLNNPVGNVIVNFKSENGESKMRVTDTDGTAVYKNALTGNYNVVIEQGYSDAVVVQSQYQLTKDVTSIRVVVRDISNSMDICGAIPENSYACTVNDGSHSVVCNSGSTSYVVFKALQPGVYRVSFTSDDSAMTVGHYGIPMFVQAAHCGELEYDGKSFELIIRDQTTPYVLGLNATVDCVATLTVERTGNAPFDPSYDAEWVEVQSTANITDFDLTGKTLVDFDITAKNISVSLGDDGYYYTNNGKRVYIRITTQTGIGYTENKQFVPVLSGSLALIAGHVNDKVGVTVGGYVYDENGNFVEKLKYNEMIKTYMDYADPTYGVVPLTEELADCIKLHGNANAWYDSSSGGYLFGNIIGVNNDNAWLFLCMVEK